MANALKDIEQALPEGVFYSETHQEYLYGAFKMPSMFLVRHPHFDWPAHIGQTLTDCLMGTITRFMKVV